MKTTAGGGLIFLCLLDPPPWLAILHVRAFSGCFPFFWSCCASVSVFSFLPLSSSTSNSTLSCFILRFSFFPVGNIVIPLHDVSSVSVATLFQAYHTYNARVLISLVSLVCVLHIKRLFLPVDIHRNQSVPILHS